MKAKGKKISMMLAGLVLVVGLSTPAPAAAPKDSDTFAKQLLVPYLAIRTSLAADTTKGVDKSAAQFGAILKDGISKAEKAKKSKAYISALKGMQKDAGHLAMKGLGLDHYREHFGKLSDLFIAFARSNVSARDAEKLQLYYCGMAKHYWLQKSSDKIGNPYYGKSMSDCGEKKPVHPAKEDKSGEKHDHNHGHNHNMGGM